MGEKEEAVVLLGEDDGREVAVLGSRPRRCTEARVFLQCVPKYVGGGVTRRAHSAVEGERRRSCW